MQLTLAHVGPKVAKSGAKSHYDALTRLYLERIEPYYPCRAEAFPSEVVFLASLGGSRLSGTKSKAPVVPVLLDSRGRQLTSVEFAAWIGGRRDRGAQHIAFAIGPADGWSAAALNTVQQSRHPGILLSFGAITMAHELARLVLAEQLYRACTILAGHPYHSGH